MRTLVYLAFTLGLIAQGAVGVDPAAPEAGSQIPRFAMEQPVRWQKCASFGPGRIFHSAIWTYHAMIVWGGGSEHQFYRSGGMYDPELDRWKAISEEGAPSGRWGHAAIWTGTEMIVWGGRSSFSAANHHRDGGIYDPRTDRWRPMSTEGAPEARSQMAVVWTGEEMIVWGGLVDDGKCPATGGAYNPREDRWRELPIDGAPQGRMEPSAVWTGREMIVWGGLKEGGLLSDGSGARFDPESRKWTALPPAGAPKPARGHHALWTGQEMVVWGGAHLHESERVNRGMKTGGAYSPEMNRWRTLPVPQGIDGRLYHVAVWTGTEMVVWGGGDQERGNIATGGRYHWESGEWAALPEANAPSARSMSTAVWTGESMLIYGGSTGGTAAFDETYAISWKQVDK